MDYRKPLQMLRDCRYRQLAHIAETTGLGIQTLRSLRYGTTDDPRLSTLEKVRDYFAAHPIDTLQPPPYLSGKLPESGEQAITQTDDAAA